MRYGNRGEIAERNISYLLRKREPRILGIWVWKILIDVFDHSSVFDRLSLSVNYVNGV